MLFEEQVLALAKCQQFIHENQGKPEVLVFSAAGGTGKTTVIRECVKSLQMSGLRGLVCAFTGRAASQLRRTGLDAHTFHSIMYEPIFNEKDELIKFELRSVEDFKEEVGQFIICDEASMVPFSVVEAMKSVGVPIIMVGDPSQLPPVEKDPELKDFNPMHSFKDAEVVTLKTNRRVADGREGLLQLNEHMRENERWPFSVNGGGVEFVKIRDLSTEHFKHNDYDVILCAYNKTRREMNDKVRRAKGYTTTHPQVGETVVCLRNSIVNEQKVNNGDLFRVDGIIEGERDATYMLTNLDNGFKFNMKVWHETWETEQYPVWGYPKRNQPVTHQLMTFGYCISTHKAQGSTFKSVLFVDQDTSKFFDQQKFRYTGISRAQDKVTIARY